MHAASPKGFAAVARDGAGPPLDLHQLMVPRPAATFFMRVQGDAMVPALRPGALLVIDRSLAPRAGDIVVAAVGGAYVTRRWTRTPAGVVLQAENSRHPPLAVSARDDFELFGVVTWTAKAMRQDDA